MNPKTEKIIVGAVAVIAAVLIVFFVQNVFRINAAMSSSQTAWKGGVPGTLSAERFPVVGSAVATPANSLEWSLPGETITLLIAATPAGARARPRRHILSCPDVRHVLCLPSAGQLRILDERHGIPARHHLAR